MVTIMKDGTRSEVGTIGNEGMVGIPVFLGAKSIPAEAFAQVSGDALQIPVKAFRHELQNGSALKTALNLYTQALFTQIAQSVSCNRLHNIRQRCSRWLLMTHDRVGMDRFHLTQEFLAQMLGVRRAGVNGVARELQEAGSIDFLRGLVTIKNRKLLERSACECYQIIKDEYDRLLT